MNGNVKWYSDAKGYGFIQAEGLNDIFVHYSCIVGDGFKTLSEGQAVEFDLVSGPNGNQAVQVKKAV